MFKIGDNVRILKERRVGKITNIIDDTAIVKFENSDKIKTRLSYLSYGESNDVIITPEKYDEAVKALMYTAAESAESDEQLNGILEVIGAICAQLKARLFDGN